MLKAMFGARPAIIHENREIPFERQDDFFLRPMGMDPSCSPFGDVVDIVEALRDKGKALFPFNDRKGAARVPKAWDRDQAGQSHRGHAPSAAEFVPIGIIIASWSAGIRSGAQGFAHERNGNSEENLCNFVIIEA
jgi:hypothetical protein